MPAAQTPQFLAFLAKFRAAMNARFPGATLVNATSAGAPPSLITGLVPIVDQMMVMAYNYRWTGSTVTGAIAPLDHASRNVKIHMTRFAAYAPRDKLIMGVPYYGYDWPVTSTVPNATVRSDKTKYGAVASVTYASARSFLAAHPDVVRQYDALEGSAFYSYWDASHATWRQVYFEDEHSAAAKYDYAIAERLRRHRDLDARQRRGLPRDVGRAARLLQPEPRGRRDRPRHRHRPALGRRVGDARVADPRHR